MRWVRVARWSAGSLGALVWLAAPVVVLVRADDAAGRQALRAEEPTWAPVQPDTDDTVAEVGLRLTWSSPGAMVAPAWTGLVEEVLVAPGQPVADGQAVLVAAGVTRLAMTGRPIGRLLGPGDRGPDVASLNDLLARRGWPATSGDRFTARTAQGVRDLSESIGLTSTSTFDPAWVLHLPEPGAALATVDLTVGAPLPAAGTVVATFAPSLSTVTVIDAHTDAAAAGPVAAAPNAEGGASGAPPPVDPALLRAEARPVAAGSALRVGTEDLTLGDDRSSVHPSSLPLVAREVDPLAPYAPAELVTPPAEGGWVVPAAAVITGEGGACLFVRTDGGRPRTVAVAIEGGQEARTRVVAIDGDLGPADEAMVAPPSRSRRCG